ncbi:molybdopterin molybdotransferase MoeA [Gorillibacterium sp. sgz5001074]|uniref:molybdopterin molybdotransferase MoeA n=1 Tax=Gorillibacterium sp. sgz5001074 TaxID=3446695 RepID=UPI003F67D58A
MKFNREIIPAGEAQSRVMQHVRPGAAELVRLEDAWGRRLAEDLTAAHPVPHFRRSGMDGFALRSVETAGASVETPVRLKVAATIPCGEVMREPLLPGQAARIMTGAAVPDEADAVIMFEQTDSVVEDGVAYVSVHKEMRPGANVSEVGLEMRQGELLLEAGRIIGAGESALLAMFGHSQVRVAVRPRVAVFATGTELLRVDEPLVPGRIRNSNGYMLAAQVREAGAVPFIMEAIPDDVELAKKAILRAMDEYDAVVTTGGVSVGDYDILYDLTQQWDGELLFNKVAMRPGSPTTAGVRNGKLLFALSGNPGACFVGFELFVRPALYAMQGVRQPLPAEHQAVLSVDYAKGDKFTKYLRGVRTVAEDGTVYVAPVGIDASSITVSIRDSDCLIVIPFGENGVQKGETVRVIPLGAWGGTGA